MLQALGQIAGRLVHEVRQSFARPRKEETNRHHVPSAAANYQPLKRVIVTDGVGRTLFEEYAAHQAGSRGEEETGWVILGLRKEAEAIVLATLPAGAARDAGVAHVQFDSGGQVIGSRYVRQTDRRLTILGVVHTHPGSLRHPSDGDFRGDSIWVGQLRGEEGIFGIGTADNKPDNGTEIAYQPKEHVQCLGKLRLTWYALHNGEKSYRPLPAEFTLGPDIARPLHAVWDSIETHAERLDRLCRQQSGVDLEVISGELGPALAVNLPLAEQGQAIRVVVEEGKIQYYWLRGGTPMRADPRDARIDRAVYLLLAELAAGNKG